MYADAAGVSLPIGASSGAKDSGHLRTNTKKPVSRYENVLDLLDRGRTFVICPMSFASFVS